MIQRDVQSDRWQWQMPSREDLSNCLVWPDFLLQLCTQLSYLVANQVVFQPNKMTIPNKDFFLFKSHFFQKEKAFYLIGKLREKYIRLRGRKKDDRSRIVYIDGAHRERLQVFFFLSLLFFVCSFLFFSSLSLVARPRNRQTTTPRPSFLFCVCVLRRPRHKNTPKPYSE